MHISETKAQTIKTISLNTFLCLIWVSGLKAPTRSDKNPFFFSHTGIPNFGQPLPTGSHPLTLGVKYFQKYLNGNANTSKFFKCKCKYTYFYFLQMQMQILFKSISNTFSNTFKYFDRYAISIKNRNNNKK